MAANGNQVSTGMLPGTDDIVDVVLDCVTIALQSLPGSGRG